jgi:hypothetical protein
MTAIPPYRIAIQPAISIDLVSLSPQPTFNTVRGDEAEAELSRTWSKYHVLYIVARGWRNGKRRCQCEAGRSDSRQPTRIRDIGLNPGPLVS